MNLSKSNIFWSILVVIAALVSACQPAKVDENPSPLPDTPPEYLIGVVLDLSGSYAQLMTDNDGKAYQFFVALVDKFFRDRAGADDRIVIAQISAVPRALLWEGSPAALKQVYPSATEFSRFLQAHSNPNGSRVHDSIADLVDYFRDYAGVADGKTKSAIFVLSDMEENFPEPDKSEERLVQSLRAYAKLNGVVGMYWVDHRFSGTWKRHLKEAGFRSFAVESEIVARPNLPSFDQ